MINTKRDLTIISNFSNQNIIQMITFNILDFFALLRIYILELGNNFVILFLERQFYLGMSSKLNQFNQAFINFQLHKHFKPFFVKIYITR